MKPQPWLLPLTPLYTGAVRANNALYDRGLRKPQRLAAPVISVGNLSTGGRGKTPFVLALARLMTDAGLVVDVLSRGYGRSGDGVERVLPDSVSAAQRFGDEPLLIARATGVPVYVGRSRFEAGVLAERRSNFPPDAHLLDDGFQHRQLARALDIVLVHPDDLTARLLPAGHLREPLSSLRRAHVVVFRQEDEQLTLRLQPYLDQAAQIWQVKRKMSATANETPTLAFCGLARPEQFFHGLRDLGVTPAAIMTFPDHHAYSDADVMRICDRARQSSTGRFLTTAKDHVRLSSSQVEALQQCAPVEIVGLETHILDPDTVLRRIRQMPVPASGETQTAL